MPKTISRLVKYWKEINLDQESCTYVNFVNGKLDDSTAGHAVLEDREATSVSLAFVPFNRGVSRDSSLFSVINSASRSREALELPSIVSIHRCFDYLLGCFSTIYMFRLIVASEFLSIPSKMDVLISDVLIVCCYWCNATSGPPIRQDGDYCL